MRKIIILCLYWLFLSGCGARAGYHPLYILSESKIEENGEKTEEM